MKKSICFYICVCNLTIIFAQNIHSISPKHFREIIDTDHNEIILDVRTTKEYNSGHIENAIHINYYKPKFKKKLSQFNRNKNILVYCKSGVRSTNTIKMLKKLGFKKIYDLEGGIDNWKKQQYQIVYP